MVGVLDVLAFARIDVLAVACVGVLAFARVDILAFAFNALVWALSAAM